MTLKFVSPTQMSQEALYCVKNTGSGSSLSRFRLTLRHERAVWQWMSHLTSLYLSSPIYELALRIRLLDRVVVLQGQLRVKGVYVKHSDQWFKLCGQCNVSVRTLTLYLDVPQLPQMQCIQTGFIMSPSRSPHFLIFLRAVIFQNIYFLKRQAMYVCIILH